MATAGFSVYDDAFELMGRTDEEEVELAVVAPLLLLVLALETLLPVLAQLWKDASLSVRGRM